MPLGRKAHAVCPGQSQSAQAQLTAQGEKQLELDAHHTFEQKPEDTRKQNEKAWQSKQRYWYPHTLGSARTERTVCVCVCV